MITFLWMLYLAFTIFYTIMTFRKCMFEIFTNNFFKYTVPNIIIISILWSMWYFYYLN